MIVRTMEGYRELNQRARMSITARERTAKAQRRQGVGDENCGHREVRISNRSSVTPEPPLLASLRLGGQIPIRCFRCSTFVLADLA